MNRRAVSEAITHLHKGETAFPAGLVRHLGAYAPEAVTLRGEMTVWGQRNCPTTALLCSSQAPAGVILGVHHLAQAWRTGALTIIGGFHSPVEREALTVLLRGPRPVILCPARGIATMRLKPEYKAPVAAGRLLLMSPFDDKVRRMTKETAMFRNRFVAALADAVLIAHARPGSKTEALAREVIGWGKPVYTLDHPANSNLLELGARRMEAAELDGPIPTTCDKACKGES